MIMHLSIQCKDTAQTWTTTLHSRLAIQTNRDDKVLGMCITIGMIESNTDIPDCMSAEEIRVATLDDDDLGLLSAYVLCS